MAVVYADQETKQPHTDYIDYFSDILSHDALFISGCIESILNIYIKNNTNQSNYKKVHFWNDTGRHFQCGELAHYLLTKVPSEFNVQVTWNFFGEHHGKSIVDGHFGTLSQQIRDIEKTETLDSVDSLIQNLNLRQQQINQSRMSDQVCWFFLKYDREGREEKINTLNINHLCDYYYFESVFENQCTLIRAKILTSSKDFQENFTFTEKAVSEKRPTKRGSVCTEQTKKRKRETDEEEVFGPIVQKKYRRLRTQLSLP
jgi:hypothetical protein